MDKAKKIGLWMLQILLAAFFVMASLPKLTNHPGAIELFRRYGYPENFHLLVGGGELGGAIGVLIPPVSAYGAAALGVIMVGACVTHLVNAEFSRAVFTFVLLLFLSLVAYARRPGFLRRGAG